MNLYLHERHPTNRRKKRTMGKKLDSKDQPKTL